LKIFSNSVVVEDSNKHSIAQPEPRHFGEAHAGAVTFDEAAAPTAMFPTLIFTLSRLEKSLLRSRIIIFMRLQLRVKILMRLRRLRLQLLV
jgi:hypothetical protein